MSITAWLSHIDEQQVKFDGDMLVSKVLFSVNCATPLLTPLSSNKTSCLYKFWKYYSMLFIEFTSNNTHVP